MNWWVFFILLVVILLIIWYLVRRPARRQQQESSLRTSEPVAAPAVLQAPDQPAGASGLIMPRPESEEPHVDQGGGTVDVVPEPPGAIPDEADSAFPDEEEAPPMPASQGYVYADAERGNGHRFAPPEPVPYVSADYDPDAPRQASQGYVYPDAERGRGERFAPPEPVPYVSADYDPDAPRQASRGYVYPDTEREAAKVAAEAHGAGEGSRSSEPVPLPPAVEPEGATAEASALPAASPETNPSPPSTPEQPIEHEIEQVWDGPFGPGSAEAGPEGEGPRGWTVKAARQTKVYLTPDVPVYAAARANVWFVDEERARDAGFKRWEAPRS